MKKGDKTIKFRRPLTTDILFKLTNKVDLKDYNNRVLLTMAAVGVYTLMRIGELCYVKVGKKGKWIKNKDIVFGENNYNNSV